MHKDRNHEWVKLALQKRGLTFTKIADRLGVTVTTVCMVSRGAGRSRRIEAEIADAIGYPASSVWPDRYIDGAITAPDEPRIAKEVTMAP